MTPSNVLRKLFIDPKSLGRWCLLGCALVGAQVSAQVSPGKSGFSYINMPDGRTVVHAGGTVVRTLPAIPTPPAGAAVVSRGMGISSAAGSITAAGRIPVSVANASPLVVDVVAKVSKTPAAALLVKGLRMLPALSTGFAIYDLLQELGIDGTKGADGEVRLTERIPGVLCSNGTCVEFKVASPSASWEKSPAAALAQWVAYVNSQDAAGASGTRWFVGPCNATGCMLRTQTYTPTSTGPMLDDGINYPYTRTVPESTTTTEQPVSLEQLEGRIANKSSWPASSSVAPALRDASDLTGEPIPLDDGPTVTGPATSPPVSSTTQNSDGTKSVTTTTANHTYQGDTINTTTVTTTNNYDSHDVIIDSTTTTTTPPPADKPSDCEANPDSNACRQDEFDVPTDQVPKTTKTITWAAENLGFGSGQCIPPVTLTNRLGTQTISFQPYCDAITTWVKPLVLAFSLLAAFFIVAPIKQEGV